MELDLGKDRSCWTCRYQMTGGPHSFLGFCSWFSVVRKENAKPITAEIVDKGCKFHDSLVPKPLEVAK